VNHIKIHIVEVSM